MNVVCISASNVLHYKSNSTPSRVCERIKETIDTEHGPEATAEIIELSNYELKPCIGCGKCYEVGTCGQDDNFNLIFAKLVKADALFIVSAHYAPIPSKLAMLLEKIEQLAFLRRFHDDHVSPLHGKPAGIIAHGGGTNKVMRSYKAMVLDTIANALSWPVGMNIVGISKKWPNGVVFPV